MRDPGQPSNNSMAISRFQALLQDVSRFIDDASEEERQAAVGFLKNSRLMALLEQLQREERRQHPRKACSIDINFATWRGASSAKVNNISAGGMFIETDKELSPGEEITANLFLRNKPDPIKITAQIVWTPQRGVGVQFTSPLSEELRKLIESL